MGAEAHWLMGRVMPREFLDEVGKYLHHVAPEREDELTATIKARAEEIAEANKDLAVDGRSEGSLAICAVVLASYETLLPLFDGDERRAILYLQHATGPVLRRPYDLMFSTLNERKDPHTPTSSTSDSSTNSNPADTTRSCSPGMLPARDRRRSARRTSSPALVRNRSRGQDLFLLRSVRLAGPTRRLE